MGGSARRFEWGLMKVVEMLANSRSVKRFCSENWILRQGQNPHRCHAVDQSGQTSGLLLAEKRDAVLPKTNLHNKINARDHS